MLVLVGLRHGFRLYSKGLISFIRLAKGFRHMMEIDLQIVARRIAGDGFP